MIAWYRREVDQLTDLDRDRIRGMWLTLVFMQPVSQYVAILIADWMSR